MHLSAFLTSQIQQRLLRRSFSCCLCFAGVANGALTVTCLGRSFPVMGTVLGARWVLFLWREVVLISLTQAHPSREETDKPFIKWCIAELHQ